MEFLCGVKTVQRGYGRKPHATTWQVAGLPGPPSASQGKPRCPRPVRTRFFEFYRATSVRSASAFVSPRCAQLA
eukprot:gene16676-biopygen18810